ncbi:MAG: hypothetical protein JNM79_08785 [Burkholderiales bacterium]|nr:hypothetical protein [Burkholderiales bacterium]
MTDDFDLDFTRKPPPVPPPPGKAAPAAPAAAAPKGPAVAAKAPAVAPAKAQPATPSKPAAGAAAAKAPAGTAPAAPRGAVVKTSTPALGAPGAPAQAGERRLIGSRGEFSAALDEVIARADRTLRIFDPTLEHYGLNSAAREEQLAEFLNRRRTNRLMLVAHDMQVVTRAARFMRLLRRFSHAIAVHQTHDAIRNLEDVLIVADDLHCLRRPHFQHPKGVVYFDDRGETREWLNRFNAIWEQSNPAVSATTVGL